MKHILADGLALYYEVHGNTDAPHTLVFVNGLSQSTVAWGGYLPHLKADFRIVLLDLICQGQSDEATIPRDFDGHAADIKALLQALAIPKSTIIGISYGGAVAMRVLVNHPEIVEKGVIMASFAHKTNLFNALGLAWTNALRKGGYELMLDVMMPSVLGKTYFEKPLIPVDLLKTGRRDLYPQPQSLLKLMKATGDMADYRPQLTQVKAPVLVIAGEEDLLCTPEMNRAIAEAIPNSQFVIVPQVGHTLNLEAVQQTAHLIRDFVQKGN